MSEAAGSTLDSLPEVIRLERVEPPVGPRPVGDPKRQPRRRPKPSREEPKRQDEHRPDSPDRPEPEGSKGHSIDIRA